MVDKRFRLSDAELQRFLVDGYLVLRPELPVGFHRRVYTAGCTTASGR